MRKAFEALSDGLIPLVREHGNPLRQTLRIAHCPMAADSSGASWLQLDGDVHNPYFGAAMLTCGELQGEPLQPASSHAASHSKSPKAQSKQKQKAKPATTAKPKPGAGGKPKPAAAAKPSATPTGQPAAAPAKHDHSKHDHSGH
jgi:hypothetical protein